MERKMVRVRKGNMMGRETMYGEGKRVEESD